MLLYHGEAYLIALTTSGEECIKKLQENHFDILLLDYDIDNNKGLEILHQIINSKIKVPVVFLVQEGREDIANKALENGAFDYIVKVQGYLTALPFTITKILQELNKINQR